MNHHRELWVKTLRNIHNQISSWYLVPRHLHDVVLCCTEQGMHAKMGCVYKLRAAHVEILHHDSSVLDLWKCSTIRCNSLLFCTPWCMASDATLNLFL
jgi:hypothetical protein